MHPQAAHPMYYGPATYMPGPPPAGFPPPPPPPPGYGGYPTADGGYVYQDQAVGPVPQEAQHYAGEKRPPPPMPAPVSQPHAQVVHHEPPAPVPAGPAPVAPVRSARGLVVCASCGDSVPARNFKNGVCSDGLCGLRPIVDMKVMDRAHPETGKNLVQVMQTQKGGVAEKAGIAPGDIIMAFNKVPLMDTADFVREVANSPINGQVLVQTSRSRDEAQWLKPGTFGYKMLTVRGTRARPVSAPRGPPRGEYTAITGQQPVARIGW